jgi:peptidoglycan/xylan/chitin deacetylase (PgdA/CDA1 family)
MRVALTIDTEQPDRPCSGRALASILDTLEARRATFFIQGRWARSRPEEATRIAEGGHTLGNHTHYHAPLDCLSDHGIAQDLLEAEELIKEITGRSPRPWFRCPFGAGMSDPRVLGQISAAGYVHVGWDVDPWDWHEESDAQAVEQRVLNGVREHEDSIVLLHSWPDATADALPRILDALDSANAELVEVSDLIDASASPP